MKRFLWIILIMLIFPLFSFADDDWNSVYENDADINKPVPVVTDKEFKEAYDIKMGKKKKKKDPYANIKANDMTSLYDLEEEYPNILLTEKFYSDEGNILDEGYYKAVVVIPKKEDGKYFVHFYQGHSHKGRVQMFETKDDYDSETINYARVIDDEGTTKFIYGNIDCNLEGVLWKVR